MKLDAQWTNDCQGKKNYDGSIIEISTRYYPEGGGFHFFNSETRDFKLSENPEIKPSATCSLLIINDEIEETITEKEFNGNSFEDVASQVEQYAQGLMDRVVAAIRAEFSADKLTTSPTPGA